MENFIATIIAIVVIVGSMLLRGCIMAGVLALAFLIVKIAVPSFLVLLGIAMLMECMLGIIKVVFEMIAEII